MIDLICHMVFFYSFGGNYLEELYEWIAIVQFPWLFYREKSVYLLPNRIPWRLPIRSCVENKMRFIAAPVSRLAAALRGIGGSARFIAPPIIQGPT
ncbi:MAG: hypothetical protein Q7T25_02550 [Sideroxyarcus sp.]|nr:hypothetical protein [Sideroxyarcus sp.]